MFAVCWDVMLIRGRSWSVLHAVPHLQLKADNLLRNTAAVKGIFQAIYIALMGCTATKAATAAVDPKPQMIDMDQSDLMDMDSSFDTLRWKNLPKGVAAPPSRRMHDRHLSKLDHFMETVEQNPLTFQIVVKIRRDQDKDMNSIDVDQVKIVTLWAGKDPDTKTLRTILACAKDIMNHRLWESSFWSGLRLWWSVQLRNWISPF